MDDFLASCITQANDLRQLKVHGDIAPEVQELIEQADSLLEDALHLATTFDPEA